jgi:hypothetical protein
VWLVWVLWTEKTGKYPLVPSSLDFASYQCAVRPEKKVTFLMPNFKVTISQELLQHSDFLHQTTSCILKDLSL